MSHHSAYINQPIKAPNQEGLLRAHSYVSEAFYFSKIRKE